MLNKRNSCGIVYPAANAALNAWVTLVGPSINNDAGSIIQNPNIVNTANILAGVKFSPNGLPDSTFFDKIALVADVTADSVPDVNDNHVNDNSFNDAIPTPAMIGINDK